MVKEVLTIAVLTNLKIEKFAWQWLKMTKDENLNFHNMLIISRLMKIDL